MKKIGYSPHLRIGLSLYSMTSQSLIGTVGISTNTAAGLVTT